MDKTSNSSSTGLEAHNLSGCGASFRRVCSPREGLCWRPPGGLGSGDLSCRAEPCEGAGQSSPGDSRRLSANHNSPLGHNPFLKGDLRGCLPPIPEAWKLSGSLQHGWAVASGCWHSPGWAVELGQAGPRAHLGDIIPPLQPTPMAATSGLTFPVLMAVWLQSAGGSPPQPARLGAPWGPAGLPGGTQGHLLGGHRAGPPWAQCILVDRYGINPQDFQRWFRTPPSPQETPCVLGM